MTSKYEIRAVYDQLSEVEHLIPHDELRVIRDRLCGVVWTGKGVEEIREILTNLTTERL